MSNSILLHIVASSHFPHIILISLIYGVFSIMKMQNTWAIAMCYVPWQRWGDLYDPCKALKCGTLFPVLSKPFAGGRV